MMNRCLAIGLFFMLSSVTHQGSKKGMKENFKRGFNKGLDTLEGIPLIGSVVKGARKLIPGADSEMVGLMEEQVETSKTALEEMQALAKDMLALKHNIEEAAAIKRDGAQLFKALADEKYGKLNIGIAEKISQISLNPSDYIPSLEAPGAIKGSCSFSFYREKALLGSIDSFSNRDGKFLGSKPSKGLNALCHDIQKELLRAEQVKIATKECNNQLIPFYQEHIQRLAAQNKKSIKHFQILDWPKMILVNCFN